MNLVLHHGLFGFASLGEIVYFNGVKEHLAARFPGLLRILVTQVPPAGTIEVRGTSLGRQIQQALQPGGALDPDETVHIIAHSMGGLDSRFLLSPDNPDNMADRISSLTTIATPHRGSPVADVLVAIENAVGIGDEESLLINTLRAALEQANIEVGGVRSLTTESLRRFNEQFRDNDATVKFSVAGVGRGIRIIIPLDTCGALRVPHRIIESKTGEDNDGLVSPSSAAWGTGPELWRADHADEIGHNLDLGFRARPRHFDYLSKYEALVDRLRQL